MLIIDPASGSMFKLDTPPINVTLAKLNPALTVTEPTLKIIDIKDVPANMRADLVKVK